MNANSLRHFITVTEQHVDFTTNSIFNKENIKFQTMVFARRFLSAAFRLQPALKKIYIWRFLKGSACAGQAGLFLLNIWLALSS